MEWTREQIADFMATIEPKEEPSQVAVPEPSKEKAEVTIEEVLVK
jgi:hypothetical protein